MSQKPPGPNPARSGAWFQAFWILALAIGLAGAIAWHFGKRSPQPEPASAQSVAQDRPSAEPAASARPAAPFPPALAAGWTRSTNAPLIARLFDVSLPLAARRRAARELARIGSDDAIAALKVALAGGPPYLKAAIGEGLGESPNPEAGALLRELANDTDETAARGAVRGLAMRGGAEAAEALAGFLGDEDKPESVRTEAALALGDVEGPEALAALTRAVAEIHDESIAGSILEGLAKRPFDETEQAFSNYLETPNLTGESKAAALEALANTQGEVAPFLIQYAADPDSQVRAAAAWSLTSTESETNLSPQLTDWLKQETDSEVRTRLYQALGNQDNYDVTALMALAQKETDPAARLAGLELLGRACGPDSTPDLLSFFNQTAVPELTKAALSGDNPQQRLNSVQALSQAGTPESIHALQQIAGSSGDPAIVAAAQGMR
jgi:HEAT repeat protein